MRTHLRNKLTGKQEFVNTDESHLLIYRVRNNVEISSETCRSFGEGIYQLKVIIVDKGINT